jgi:hypothetical protein
MGFQRLGPGAKERKTEMKKTIPFLLIVLTLFASCNDSGRAKNRKLQEAAKIHEDIMTRHDSIYSKLLREKERVSEVLEEGNLSSDKQGAYESMIRSIDKSFRILGTWEESVVGVPGFEHHHGEHTHHDHDHASDEILDGMSDEEILELQKAYQTRLSDVIEQIEGLLTTIEMYEDAN